MSRVSTVHVLRLSESVAAMLLHELSAVVSVWHALPPLSTAALARPVVTRPLHTRTTESTHRWTEGARDEGGLQRGEQQKADEQSRAQRQTLNPIAQQTTRSRLFTLATRLPTMK